MCYVILAAVIVLDQLTKMVINSGYYVGESTPIIENVFHITYIQNTGAAFSFMTGHTVLLSVLTGLVLLGLLIYMIFFTKDQGSLFRLSLALIISGGISNLIDRVCRGYVVDMFDFRIWPVFNVADIAICIGCGLLIVYVLFVEPKIRKKNGTD